MKPSTITRSSFLHIYGGTARQIITVISVEPKFAICLVETVHPDGTVSQDRLTSILRTAIPSWTLQAVQNKEKLGF